MDISKIRKTNNAICDLTNLRGVVNEKYQESIDIAIDSMKNELTALYTNSAK